MFGEICPGHFVFSSLRTPLPHPADHPLKSVPLDLTNHSAFSFRGRSPQPKHVRSIPNSRMLVGSTLADSIMECSSIQVTTVHRADCTVVWLYWTCDCTDPSQILGTPQYNLKISYDLIVSWHLCSGASCILKNGSMFQLGGADFLKRFLWIRCASYPPSKLFVEARVAPINSTRPPALAQ